MSNTVLYSGRLSGSKVNTARGVHADIDDAGTVQIATSATALKAALEAQGVVQVDVEGDAEAITPGTAQTTGTALAFVFLNDDAATVVGVTNDEDFGEDDPVYLLGPFSLAADEARVILTPGGFTPTDGIIVEAISGALLAASFMVI